MTARKKPDPTIIEASFEDGPMSGQSMRVKNPPATYMRLAFPEWGTYKWSGSVYEYIGDVRLVSDSLFEEPMPESSTV